MKTILIANPKGGSGKTTLATNIAGYLAAAGQTVRLLDMDRQQSASGWLALRSEALPPITLFSDKVVTNAAHEGWLVIDSPAGLHGKNLERALKLVDRVVVPIAPSLFDMNASKDFLDVLQTEKAIRKGKIFVGVVGMRMAPRTLAAAALEQFLQELDMPILAYLREAQLYVNAAFEGKSLFDLPPYLAERELEQWQYLLSWLDAKA
ncbi:putative partition-related protein [Sulfuriferula multivorans]|uniref:Putative partition-related protein n=1 Tax=Sulfuriferula multivorans TaxID=1559896 RepID=A0A401JZ38_9PROT|nr:ParA family protein [Sulfuriferula multivorans]GCB02363.1 putative partition-related protein [Sulfuriferula multivorans]